MLLFAPPARAQFDSAQVSGVVQDPSGGVLPGVDIVLTNSGSGLEQRTVTNGAGLFTFPNVPVGDYRVTASLQGFKTTSRPAVRVSAGVNIRVDMALEVGALSETILVQAATTLVDTAVIGRTVQAEQIAETPLSGRRASQVAQLMPGVVGGNPGVSLPTGVNTFATGVTSINGGRSDEFLTTVDGAPSIRIRQAGGFMMGAQNYDTVAEVQVLTTNYQAEFGRASAGQLRLVTKSGTQSFRGNAFWTHQDDALDTNTWSRENAGLEKSPHNYNAYGFTLGGPVYIPGVFNDNKQKLFFFWGEEWQRDRTVEEQTAIVPTQAMRNGDFSALLPGRVIRDPRTGQPFPGNIIPADRFSPQGRALLNAYPLPIPGFQQGANNWIGNPAAFNNQRKDSLKIDLVLSQNHRLAVRHTWAPNVWNDPEPMTVYSTIWDYPGRTLAAMFTSSLSSSLINEFSFSWGSTSPSKYFGQRNCDYCPGGTEALLYPRNQDVGLSYPYLFPGTKLDPDKISNVSLDGFTAINNAAYPGSWNDFVFLWADNVTKVTGNHVFKAGMSIERSGMNDRIQLSFAQAPATTNQNGSFRFFNATRPDSTGYSVANALLGMFDDYTEFGNKPNTKWLAMAFDWFAQDSWKPTRDLTLELGLRYSLWQPWGTTNQAMASFNPEFYNPATAAVINPALGSVVSGDRFNGIVLPGDAPTEEAIADFPQLASLQRLYHGVPNGFSETPKDGLQPRLGLAYAINDRTTFRAGAGRFLNRVQINTTAAYGFNPPLSEMQTVINGVVDAPGGATTRNFPLVMAMQSPDFTNPRSWAWNATLDRDLPWLLRGSVSYVGRSASHLERARNINQLQPGTIQANPGVNANALRPYLGLSTITLYETTGRSSYNSFQTQVNRRLSRGFAFTAAYTFSRTKDNGSGRNDLLPNAYDDSGYYGISDLDRPHVFISQVRYPIPAPPSSSAPLRWVLGDWDISGVFQAQSGAPFDVRTVTDIAGVGPGSGQQFYNLVGDPKQLRTDFDPALGYAIWFERTAFQAPAPGTFGNQPQNTLRYPGYWDIHMLVRKRVSTINEHRVEFRVEAFNILNHRRLNDAIIGNNVNNPNVPNDFGRITSLTGNRTVQIGLQYLF